MKLFTFSTLLSFCFPSTQYSCVFFLPLFSRLVSSLSCSVSSSHLVSSRLFSVSSRPVPSRLFSFLLTSRPFSSFLFSSLRFLSFRFYSNLISSLFLPVHSQSSLDFAGISSNLSIIHIRFLQPCPRKQKKLFFPDRIACTTLWKTS